MLPKLDAEWLETDGLGGFASGTVAGPRLRRYHALLLPALEPPAGRTALVAGFDAWLEGAGVPGSPEFLTVQRYTSDVTSRSTDHLADFSLEPWPTWLFRLPGGLEIEHELFVPARRAMVVVRWRLRTRTAGIRLRVRPFLLGRDAHALHHENASFRFDPVRSEPSRVEWRPYPDVAGVCAVHSGAYTHQPVWYRRFQLDMERSRGFDYAEDAGSPGIIEWDLSAGEAVWVLAAEGQPGADLLDEADAPALARRLARSERARRARLGPPLARAAAAYVVRRGAGRTVIAGYPWFTDWGRDTFIAMRGLSLVTGRFDDARAILAQWATTVSGGMMPNRFVDAGGQPEFNSVDASLWFVVVAGELVREMDAAAKRLPAAERRAIEGAVQAVLEGYLASTRYGIHVDRDGLLAAGAPGVSLTWMDARVDGRAVTPRIGKPVEVQALWVNALRVGATIDARWGRLAQRAVASFRVRFWNPDRACLFDVVDADHLPGKVDPSLRPNQIFAAGGLPESLLEDGPAGAVVDLVERELLTPMGLRTLAPSETGYVPRYHGGPAERDAAYHQGTVWPWLLGPFVDAWLRRHGSGADRRALARQRFLTPLLAHLGEAGLGHLAEIADAEPPHTPRGCPFQAWSLGEALRIDRLTAP